MKVLITGSNGFLGKNLQLYFAEREDVEVVCFTREHSWDKLASLLQDVDFIFHFAGVNRTRDPADFTSGNVAFTVALCEALADLAVTTGRKIPVIFTSSTQAALDNFYGASKRGAEDALLALKAQHGVPVHIFRLPNLFGKWGKPNYNSVVATFCYNVCHDLPIRIHDPTSVLNLVYVEDVLQHFIHLMDGADLNVNDVGFSSVVPHYTTNVGEVARLIKEFKNSRLTLRSERVGVGLIRALYATYVSYIPAKAFTYPLPMHRDPRGVFAEMLKTPDCGQFSYFTAHPGINRGGHYHHSKSEKFLVVKGQARFRFRHMHTGEMHELTTTGEIAEIVETVPGWTHDITNIGTDEMIVMLWANEIFDHKHTDTFVCKLN